VLECFVPYYISQNLTSELFKHYVTASALKLAVYPCNMTIFILLLRVVGQELKIIQPTSKTLYLLSQAVSLVQPK